MTQNARRNGIDAMPRDETVSADSTKIAARQGKTGLAGAVLG